MLDKSQKRIALAKLRSSELTIKAVIAQLKADFGNDAACQDLAADLEATAARCQQVVEMLDPDAFAKGLAAGAAAAKGKKGDKGKEGGQ